MPRAPQSLVGMSLEWTGVHHSGSGDFADLSTHTVSGETADRCYVTADGRLVGEARYVFRRPVRWNDRRIASRSA